MKLGWVVLALVLCTPVWAQEARSRATYAVNGTLIGLADLAPLRDCSVRSMEGKVKRVKAKSGVVSFDLDAKDQRMTFQFPIERLAAAEQMTFRKDFLHKGLRLRASGYACKGDGDALETISVDRAY